MERCSGSVPLSVSRKFAKQGRNVMSRPLSDCCVAGRRLHGVQVEAYFSQVDGRKPRTVPASRDTEV